MSVILRASDWVWHTSLSAVVIVVCVTVVQLLCGKVLPARARLALWWLVAIRLLLPGVPGSPFGVANLPDAVGATEVLSIPVVHEVAQHSPALSMPSPNGARVLPWRQVLTIAWLAGAAAWLLAVWVQHWKLAKWVRRQRPHEASGELLRECVANLGITRPVEIIASNSLAIPAVFGIGRPRILMPTHLLESLERAQLRLVILHELIHIKRYDVLQNWILIVLQSVHWFNPAIWFAFRRLRAERELVCDRGVLKHLTGEARGAYGTLLIKLAELSAGSPAVPTLVPILNHKKHIERRIRMIPKFKVVSAWTAVVSALAVAAIACIVLTGAAERQSPAKATDSPTAANPAAMSNQAAAAKSRERALDQMNEELDRLSAMIQSRQHELDKMKQELGISALDEMGKPDPELLRRMESMRIERQAEYENLSNLYRNLTSLSRPELKKSMPNAVPDELLNKLWEQLSNVEQQHAEAVENFGVDHPDVKKRKRVLEQVNMQINDRLEGILQGLKVRTEATEISVQRLTEEVQRLKSAQIKRSIEQVPYFRAKRELENLQAVYDQLYRRFLEARIDAKVSPEAK